MSAAEQGEFSPLEALTAMGPGDTTGTQTLERYIYQCKVAVQRWLATLPLDSECHIVCEFVDDITFVTDTEIIFAQVKTRDRGAWTASRVLESSGGMDALVRSYNLAKSAGYRGAVYFELILEGPAGADQDTRRFFDNPLAATERQRQKLVNLCLAPDDTEDFLSRLTVTPQYHARQSIDGVTLQMLMAIAPGHSASIQTTYDNLLQQAISAHLGLAAQADHDSPLVLQPRTGTDTPSILETHALSRSRLLALLPLTPSLVAEQRELIEAVNSGALTMTNLELKLRVAGAADNTVRRAKERRAEASTALMSRPVLGPEPDSPVTTLRERLLEHAEGVVADIVATAALEATRIQPADAVWGRLVQQIGTLGELDREGVFEGNGSKVLGYLCELSDQCHFLWRRS